MEKNTRNSLIGGGIAIASLVGVALALGNAPSGRQAEWTPPTSTFPQEQLVPAVGNGQLFGEYGLADLVDEEWLADTADATGIPIRALRSYAGAEIAFSQGSTQCNVDWSTLAGVGFVESRHGTLQGGRILDNGQQDPEIFGIPLDGQSSTAEIPDTDGGVLDGDEVWDRAVGPMQFIPSTWDYLGSDGNLDGVRDPQNMDDAVLAAGRHLCFNGGDLTNGDDWIDAVWSYNRSVEYNNAVASAADRYRQAASQ